MTPRWTIERVFANDEREILQTIIVFPPKVSAKRVRKEIERSKIKGKMIRI